MNPAEIEKGIFYEEYPTIFPHAFIKIHKKNIKKHQAELTTSRLMHESSNYAIMPYSSKGMWNNLNSTSRASNITMSHEEIKAEKRKSKEGKIKKVDL